MTKISDLIPDNKNLNKGNEQGNKLIETSLSKFGAGRSILLDKNNRIIAGNKTIENAGAIGLDEVQIVESDGKRIIAVKRIDIDLDSKQGREMALADNATAKSNIEWDAETIEEISKEFDIDVGEWGVEQIDNSKKNEFIDLGIKQSIQVIPKNEYIIITEPEDSDEWNELKTIFKCETVRSGGCKIGSSSDKVGMGTERVFNLKTFKERVGL